MRRGAWWPVAIVGTLAVTVVANGVLLWAAHDRNAAVVEPEYYRKAVTWDSTMAQERRDAELGWQLDAELDSMSERGAWLKASLVDTGGRPVSDATVAVTAIHNADAARPISAVLSPALAGFYAARLPLHHRGRWELRFVARRGADTFTATLRREAGTGPGLADHGPPAGERP